MQSTSEYWAYSGEIARGHIWCVLGHKRQRCFASTGTMVKTVDTVVIIVDNNSNCKAVDMVQNKSSKT